MPSDPKKIQNAFGDASAEPLTTTIPASQRITRDTLKFPDMLRYDPPSPKASPEAYETYFKNYQVVSWEYQSTSNMGSHIYDFEFEVKTISTLYSGRHETATITFQVPSYGFNDAQTLAGCLDKQERWPTKLWKYVTNISIEAESYNEPRKRYLGR